MNNMDTTVKNIMKLSALHFSGSYSLFDMIKNIVKSDKEYIAERVILTENLTDDIIADIKKYQSYLRSNVIDDKHEISLIVETSTNSIFIVKKKKMKCEI